MRATSHQWHEAHGIIREIAAIDDEWKTLGALDSPLDLRERDRAVKARARAWLREVEGGAG